METSCQTNIKWIIIETDLKNWFIAFFVLSIVLTLPIPVNRVYKKYLNGNTTQEIASNQL